MRFGYFASLMRGEPDKPLAAVYRDTTEQIECAEAAGFDIVWFPEHHFTHNFCAPAPMVNVVDAAQRTSRMRLGTSVILSPYYHPLLVAEQIGMVDHLVDGRLEIGFARGASPYEYARLGLTEALAAERTRESVEVLLGIWGHDEEYGHDGKHFAFPPTYVVPRPYQQPHPPMWVAGRTPDTLRFCIERGIGLHTTPLRQSMAAVHATVNTIDAIVEDVGAEQRPKFAIQRETFVS